MEDLSREPKPGSLLEVFRVFLQFGVTGFGGPVAHIAYFRDELVGRRHWFSDAQFAQLLALCQFLPGPASSQLGFCLGLARAGWLGAVIAFLCFTLPSAIVLVLFAQALVWLDSPLGAAGLDGLKIVALSVVAHGLFGMARQLCPDPTRGMMAGLAAAVVVLLPSAAMQFLVVLGGALGGVLLCRDLQPHAQAALPRTHSQRVGMVLLACFFLLLFILPFTHGNTASALGLFDTFYQAGALVFGGGHVVLPWLEQSVVQNGWVSRDDFLAGYGAAQAIPGPMFSFSAYLGAVATGPLPSILGASIALLAIFVPGFLLVAGVLPFWRSLSRHVLAFRAVAGVNAAVVGILGAALYDPIWTSAVTQHSDVAIAVIGFCLLAVLRLSVLWAVLWCVAASLLRWVLFP